MTEKKTRSADMKPEPKRKSIAERLWSKVDIKSPDECWLFIGKANNGKSGYATLARPGYNSGNLRPWYAHRVAYAISQGLHPDDLPDLEVRHSCHTKKCCNPNHLSLGTSKENKQDSIKDGKMFWQRALRDPLGKFMGNS